MSPAAPLEATFAPARSQTVSEETIERIGTAIKLGLLEPGQRLPAERDLCAQMGISRSTLRQALTALVQSGHLRAVRGRRGGTFVAERLPPAPAPSAGLVAGWLDVCDTRLATELGVVVLACDRARPAALEPLDTLVAGMEGLVHDFPAYPQADVRSHIGLAEAAGSPPLVTAMTESQGAMSDLIAYIQHPAEVLSWSNAQHARLLEAIRGADAGLATRTMTEHLRGTEHVLAGLLP